MHPDGQERPALAGSPTDSATGDDREPTDGVWMTKAQLAAVRRISVASADRLIRRQGWRKHPGNDGRARVLVPRTWAERQGASPTVSSPADPAVSPQDRPTDKPIHPTDIRRTISALEGALAALRDQLARAEKRAESAETRADQAQNQANTLHERLETLQRRLATAEVEAKAVHDRAWASGEKQAAAERRADAERERANRAEASAAHERQDFLDVEVLTRRELDTLRERLAEMEKGRGEAETAAQQASVTADEILQANAARRRQSLLARLRAAWRGE
jgi:hypothetical protein